MDSYATLAEANDYWANRNDTIWFAASDAQKNAALIKATEYIDYEFDWVGIIADFSQDLSWPRAKAIDKEGKIRKGIPRELKNSVSWLAIQLLNPDDEIDPPASRGGDIQSIKAGPVEVEWGQNAPSTTTYSHIRRMLKNITRGSRTQPKLIRA